MHGFWLVQDVVLAVLGRDEVAPRTSLSLALSGVTLDSLMELQQVKGLKPGAALRLVEGEMIHTHTLFLTLSPTNTHRHAHTHTGPC